MSLVFPPKCLPLRSPGLLLRVRSAFRCPIMFGLSGLVWCGHYHYVVAFILVAFILGVAHVFHVQPAILVCKGFREIMEIKGGFV